MTEHPTLLWHPTPDGENRYCETRLPLEPQEYHVIEVPSLGIVFVIVIAPVYMIPFVGEGILPSRVYRIVSPGVALVIVTDRFVFANQPRPGSNLRFSTNAKYSVLLNPPGVGVAK